MKVYDIIERRLSERIDLKSLPTIGDYIFLIAFSAVSSFGSQFVLGVLIERLTVASDFIASILNESLGGAAIYILLGLAVWGCGAFLAGIVGGQIVRKQTVSGLIFTSILIGIGSTLLYVIGFLSETESAVIAMSMLIGFPIWVIGGFLGYLYGFSMLVHGNDWLDEHGFLWGIQRRYFIYLLPAYLLFVAGFSNMIIGTFFLWLAAGVFFNPVSYIPLFFVSFVAYGVLFAMLKAHYIIRWHTLYPLARGRRVLNVIISMFLALIPSSVILIIAVLMKVTEGG